LPLLSDQDFLILQQQIKILLSIVANLV